MKQVNGRTVHQILMVTRMCLSLGILVVFLSLSGCLMVREGNLPPPAKWPPPSAMTDKKTIALTVTGVFVSDGHERPSPPAFVDKVREQAIRAYNESNFFSNIVNDNETAELRAEIKFIEEGDETLAFLSGFISGFTLAVIPASASAEFTLQTTFKNSEQKVLGIIEKKESLSFWIQLFLLFAMPFTDGPGEVVNDTHYDLHRSTLDSGHTNGFI